MKLLTVSVIVLLLSAVSLFTHITYVHKTQLYLAKEDQLYMLVDSCWLKGECTGVGVKELEAEIDALKKELQ